MLKKIVQNIIFSGLFQFINLSFPLIIYQFLLKHIGFEKYGEITYYLSISTIYLVITEFGFNTTALRNIAIENKNKTKVIEVFNAVTSVKISISIISLLISIPFFIYFNLNITLLLLSFHIVLFDILIPNWLYISIDRNIILAGLNFILKALIAIFLFIFIHQPSDYFKFPLISFFVTILVSIISIAYIIKYQQVTFKFSSYRIQKKYILESFDIFISNVTSNLFYIILKIIIGIKFDYKFLTIYDFTEKILNLLKIPFRILHQVFFPIFSRKIKINNVKYLLSLYIFITCILVLILLFYSNFLVSYFSLSNIDNINIYLILTSLILLLFVLNNYFGSLILVAKGRLIIYKKIMVTSFLLSLFMLFIYKISNLNFIITYIIIVFYEFILLCFFLINIYKNKIIFDE